MRSSFASALRSARARVRASNRRWTVALGALVVVPLGAGRPAIGLAAGSRHPVAVAVLAGGCYWGVESVFDHVRGVASATSGYATPMTGMGASTEPAAEAVRLVYDPSRLSYRKILDVFFAVAHDPTELDRQGPDVGPQYRSVVFVESDSQRVVARAYIDSLGAAHVYRQPIVTEVDALGHFEAAPPAMQEYAERNPTDPYILANDVPKLVALHRLFPKLYRE